MKCTGKWNFLLTSDCSLLCGGYKILIQVWSALMGIISVTEVCFERLTTLPCFVNEHILQTIDKFSLIGSDTLRQQSHRFPCAEY